LSENALVGAELYYEGAQFAGDRASTFYNAGGYASLTKSFGVLLSIGHTVAGDNQSVAYCALGWSGALHKATALLDTLRTPAMPSIAPSR
jgi:hypothetical protein